MTGPANVPVNGSVIVEFTGLPGAGKSFLAAALVEALGADALLATVGPGVPTVRRLARKAALVGRAVGRSPVPTVRAVATLARSGQPLPQLVRRTQNSLVVRELLRVARSRPGVHVADQGLVQELHSLAYEGSWRGALDVAGPGPGRAGADLLIAVRVPAAVAVDRLARRADANSRLDRMAPADRPAWLAAQAAQLLEITEAWRSAHGSVVPTQFLVIDNDDDSPAALAELTRQMLAAVRSVG